MLLEKLLCPNRLIKRSTSLKQTSGILIKARANSNKYRIAVKWILSWGSHQGFKFITPIIDLLFLMAADFLISTSSNALT